MSGLDLLALRSGTKEGSIVVKMNGTGKIMILECTFVPSNQRILFPFALLH